LAQLAKITHKGQYCKPHIKLATYSTKAIIFNIEFKNCLAIGKEIAHKGAIVAKHTLKLATILTKAYNSSILKFKNWLGNRQRDSS